MEGSYNKVYNAKNNIKGNEYKFFFDSLIQTIRNEIAACSEKAYDWLPIKDACTLLFLSNTQELLNFASSRKWTFDSYEEKVFFKTLLRPEVEIPQEQIITRTLGYARELERIV
jgi:26S proteasome regulatory subunit N12